MTSFADLQSIPVSHSGLMDLFRSVRFEPSQMWTDSFRRFLPKLTELSPHERVTCTRLFFRMAIRQCLYEYNHDGHPNPHIWIDMADAIRMWVQTASDLHSVLFMAVVIMYEMMDYQLEFVKVNHGEFRGNPDAKWDPLCGYQTDDFEQWYPNAKAHQYLCTTVWDVVEDFILPLARHIILEFEAPAYLSHLEFHNVLVSMDDNDGDMNKVLRFGSYDFEHRMTLFGDYDHDGTFTFVQKEMQRMWDGMLDRVRHPIGAVVSLVFESTLPAALTQLIGSFVGGQRPRAIPSRQQHCAQMLQRISTTASSTAASSTAASSTAASSTAASSTAASSTAGRPRDANDEEKEQRPRKRTHREQSE
jgi:hypothetical protein